jgi:crotonobetainyl-CoA:carnitine CoA-transferase CaiB-like acyl-CoA transferase
VDHPEFGKVKQVGIGPKFSDTPGKVRTTAPMKGANTDEVLAEAGYSDVEVAALRDAGAIG